MDAGRTHKIGPVQRVERPVQPVPRRVRLSATRLPIRPHEVYRLIRLRLEHGYHGCRDVFAGAVVIERVRARAERASSVDDDAVFFGLAITHDGPNFSVRLFDEGDGEGMVTKPLDSPVMA